MPLKTTVIGAYPKPDFLKLPDWFRTGQDTYVPSDQSEHTIASKSKELCALQDKATKEAIIEQVELGLDIVTDGEIQRENYIYHFCRGISGFDFIKLTKRACRNGAYESEVPTVRDRLEPNAEPWVAEEWQAAQNLTATPVKMTIPGPMTIIDTTYNAFYGSREELSLDIVACINRQVRLLEQAGCKHIQIDEPLLVRDPDTALSYGIRHLEMCFDGVGPSGEDSSSMLWISTIYCESFMVNTQEESNSPDDTEYPKADRLCYQRVAPSLDQAIFDTVSIEDAHRYNDLDLFVHFKQTTLILGVVAVATTKIETKEEILERVRKVLSVLPAQRLILAPDCGLGFLPKDILRQKILNMVAAAKCLP